MVHKNVAVNLRENQIIQWSPLVFHRELYLVRYYTVSQKNCTSF